MIYNIKGNGKIIVSYDGTISYLKIDNKIIALTVHGPLQDIYNVYLIKGDFNNNVLNHFLKQINFDFYSDLNFFKEKNSQIEHLLEMFEPGIFYLEKANNFFIDKVESDCKLVVGSFKDSSRSLFATKDLDNLDETVISGYKQQILIGNKPIILSYRKDYGKGAETGESYLIDGHHKLAAYTELKIEPYIWEIVNIGQDEYEELDQGICKYLDRQKIESLKYFYLIEEDTFGNIIKLKSN